MNAPTVLTLLRIVLIPFLIVSIRLPFEGHEFIALGIFLLASFTDTVDGFWARRTNKITALGQLLDPIADKLLIVSAFICLVETGTVPAWMAVVIIGREIAVTGFRADRRFQGRRHSRFLAGKNQDGHGDGHHRSIDPGRSRPGRVTL